MPLCAAIGMHSNEGLKTLLEIGVPRGLKVNMRIEFNRATALNVAAYMGDPQQVQMLIQAGADRTAANDHGSFPLHDAASNPAMTPACLDILSEGEGVDVNAICTPRNCKWWLLDKIMEAQWKLKIDRSDFVESFANTRGSTALHEAAYMGHLSTVRWLLDKGASGSLTIRNKLNLTPMGCAELSNHTECAKVILAAEREAAGFGREPSIVL